LAIKRTIQKLATQDEDKPKTKTQHHMCWTPLCASKHKSYGTQNIKTNNRTTQKTKKMSNMDPHQKTGGELNISMLVM